MAGGRYVDGTAPVHVRARGGMALVHSTGFQNSVLAVCPLVVGGVAGFLCASGVEC